MFIFAKECFTWLTFFRKVRKEGFELLGLGRYMNRQYQPGDLIMCTSTLDNAQRVGIVVKIIKPGRYLLYFGNDAWNMTLWDRRAMRLINEAR